MAQPPDSVAKLALIDPHHANAVVNSKPPFLGGYPLPGPQSISGAAAMNKTAFVDDNTWRIIAEHGYFDDIVVGSGFCALAYITTALERDPNRKILLLERGGFWLQDHVQNLPGPFQLVHSHVNETFPWELSHDTARDGYYLSGSSPFFGGRSSFWSIWSPRAIRDRKSNEPDNGDTNFDLMRDFPGVMKKTAKNFYDETEKRILHVQKADEIADPVFKAIPLQGRVTHHLGPSADEVYKEPASLATGVPLFGPSSQGYRHFSAIASLLALNDRQNTLAEKKKGSPIMIVTDTVVERFEVEKKRDMKDRRAQTALLPERPEQPAVPAHARILHTSRGPLTLHGGKTNVILAAGAIPNTTILLNSIEHPAFKWHAGQRLTAHFRSKVMARFELDREWFNLQADNEGNNLAWGNIQEATHPVISAHHVRGRYQHDGAGPDFQWHIQLHGIYVPQNWKQHAEEIQGMVPDLWAAPTDKQLKDSGGHLVLSASILGELPENTGSKLERIVGDVTKNIRLHLNLGEPAEALWTTMVNKTFETVRNIAGSATVEADTERRNSVQFWNYTTKAWQTVLAPTRLDHSKTNKPLFHEASTNYMGEDGDLPAEDTEPVNHADRPTVDSSYRPVGLRQGNVYVTGAGLFPTAGSWNPTPTICALAQDLATTLVENKYLGRAAFNQAKEAHLNRTWFFNGAKYIKTASDEPRLLYGPLEFTSQWVSLRSAGFRQIDVIVPVPQNSNEAYAFAGNKFARIGNTSEYNQVTGAGVPRLIVDVWRSLREAGTGFIRALCGALIIPSAPTQMFFFSGDQYVHVQWSAQDNQDTLLDINLNGANVKVAAIRTRWRHIPAGRKFHTIFPDPRDSTFAYLFSGTKFWKINIANPIALDNVPAEHSNQDVATSESWPSLRQAGFV